MLKVTSSKVMPSPGPLYAIFAGEEGKDNDFFYRLQSEYFKNSGEKPFDALKNAIQKFSNIETAVCVFVDGVVYSAATGGARVMIYRNRSLVTILSSHPGDSGVISASCY